MPATSSNLADGTLVAPLAYSQRGMCFFQEFAPSSLTYNKAVAYQLDGRVGGECEKARAHFEVPT